MMIVLPVGSNYVARIACALMPFLPAKSNLDGGLRPAKQRGDPGRRAGIERIPSCDPARMAVTAIKAVSRPGSARHGSVICRLLKPPAGPRSSHRENPMRKFITVLAFLALTAFSPVLLHAEDAKPYSDNNEINLLLLLPPPPAVDSDQMKAELGEILTIQVTRSKAMVDRAVADVTENIWRFADVVDSPNFTAAALPKVAAFFDRVVETESAVVDPAKDVWKRPRSACDHATGRLVEGGRNPGRAATRAAPTKWGPIRAGDR
ncbi:MAG TPA: hypothetical protein VGN55_20620 [Xanthobacteraceae bacterium]